MTTKPPTPNAAGATQPAKLYLGCTAARHAQIGINAVVNARAGRQSLNDMTMAEVEMMRDAIKVRQHRASRVIIHQFNSRPFRRRLSHLVSSYEA